MQKDLVSKVTELQSKGQKKGLEANSVDSHRGFRFSFSLCAHSTSNLL